LRILLLTTYFQPDVAANGVIMSSLADEFAARENGYCESFNSKLHDEFLNGEIFYSLKEVRVLTERWRVYYNTERPHSSLDYRPPAPAAWQTEASQRCGKVEKQTTLPTFPHRLLLQRADSITV